MLRLRFPGLGEGEEARVSAWSTLSGSQKAWAIASLVSGVLATYHGYKRNSSVGWALGWGALGSLFPIITPTIAFAQGFAKPKRG